MSLIDAHTSARPAPTPWRTDIAGLRAVAVVAVLLFHAFPAAMPGGFAGVDVFFVISGYLITGLLVRDADRGRVSLARFYAHRARRLFPALALVLVTTVLATFYFANSPVILQTAKHSGAGALSFANIVLWHESGYFDTASSLKPLLHLWSLGVEEQFYLLWPLFMLLWASRPRWVFVFLVAASTTSFIAADLLNVSRPNLAFYSPLTRFWEIGAGALIALAEARGYSGHRLQHPFWHRLLTPVGLLLILASFWVLDPSLPFPGRWAALPVVGAMLVLVGGTVDQTKQTSAYRLLSSSIAVYLGAISYPLYLWHWPMLTLPNAFGWPTSLTLKCLGMVLAFALAMATTHWVESPIRQTPRRKLALAVACSMLIGAIGLTLGIWAAEKRTQKSSELTALKQQLHWPPNSERSDPCPPELVNEEPPLAFCKRSGQGPISAVVWGDSHADHLYPGIVAADPHRAWMLMAHMSCPPAVGINVKADQPDCAQRAELALSWLEQQKSVQLVVMALFGNYASDKDVALDHLHGITGPSRILINGQSDPAVRQQLMQEGLSASVARLQLAGKQVIFVLDSPELPFDPRNCYMPPRIELKQFPLTCSVSRQDAANRQSSLRGLANSLAQEHPGMQVVDTLPILCDTTSCSVGTAARPLYRDSHHLSGYGSSVVATALVAVASKRRPAQESAKPTPMLPASPQTP